jgi:glycine cleavage system aminomethyltransferase T
MKRSALFHLHQRSRASFASYHGWEMPAAFSSPDEESAAVRSRVGLTDISYRTKFESKIQPKRQWWLLASAHYLSIGEPPVEPPLEATDVTSVYANLLLMGPRSKDVLAKLTSLDCESLADQSCAQTGIAHVHAILLREDVHSLPAFHILVSREYAESLWQSILHAGHEFDLVPFGLRALDLLRTDATV